MSIPTRAQVESLVYEHSEAAGREPLLDADAALRAEVERLKRPRTFAERAANRLADEVAVLITRRVIDARSPAADALLDYREGMTSERADRIAALEAEVERLRARARRGGLQNDADRLLEPTGLDYEHQAPEVQEAIDALDRRASVLRAAAERDARPAGGAS